MHPEELGIHAAARRSAAEEAAALYRLRRAAGRGTAWAAGAVRQRGAPRWQLALGRRLVSLGAALQAGPLLSWTVLTRPRAAGGPRWPP